MLRSLRIAVFGLTASALILGMAGAGQAGQSGKRIEVAFVLDTTGSMADLIDGAKRKIWSIANSIVDINPNADIRMALVGYRDLDDEYVVRSHPMSGDIQGLYGNLIKFVADGGGDTPESVNQALDVAVNGLDWSTRDDVRRIIFLVGDAPPHMDYRNEPHYPEIIRQARRAGIIVNTIQAGGDPETAEYWQDMARLGEGKYFAIPQDGGDIQVLNSPYDQRIIELQGRIDRTAVPYGNRQQQDEVRAKLETKAVAPDAVKVDNSGFYSKRRAAKEIVTGGGDLIDDVRNKLRSIEEIDEADLPAELQGKSRDELAAAVEARTADREKLEAEMAGLVKQRDDFVATELKKRPKVTEDSFDRQVKNSISAQF